MALNFVGSLVNGILAPLTGGGNQATATKANNVATTAAAQV
jgi:hypothetical protein